KQCPVDGQLAWHGSEAEQVGEERHRLRVAIQLILLPNLAMPIAICGVGEFEGNERIARAREPSWALARHLVNNGAFDQTWKKFLQNCPLVVPAQLARGRLEHPILWNTLPSNVIDERVVRLEHCQMHLRYEHVRVVARIADQRSSFGVARHVGASRPEQELRRILTLVEKRMADGTVPVETLKIQLRGSSVPQATGIGMRLKDRGIGGNVVGDELTEDGPAGRDLAERARCVLDVGAFAPTASAPEGAKELFVGVERWQVREQTAVSGWSAGTVD